MFSAGFLLLVSFLISFINCKPEFMVVDGILKVTGNVEDGDWVFIAEKHGITGVDKECLQKLKNAKRLNIEACSGISILLDWVCNHMTDLIVLDISCNDLKSLPESIGNLVNLTELCVYGNELTSLPDSIGKLINLKHLDLGCNHLESLPESIGKLTSLTNLYVYDNQLGSLPESIGKMINLTSFTVRNNKLRFFPESIGELSRLTLLHAYSNQLIALPESIGKLSQLKHFDLTHNKLESLPCTLGSLRNLVQVVLSNNPLESLPEFFRNMNQLVLLGLENTLISDFPENGLGRIDLIRIFGDKVVFSKAITPFTRISKEEVYKKLKEKEMCWNFKRLNEFRHEPVQKTELSKDRMIVTVSSLAEKGKLDALDHTVLVEYIEKLHDPAREYNRWPMLPEYVEQTKNLLGCILEKMSQPDCNFDLAIIAEAIRFCPDRQMAELKQAYHFVMGQNVSQDILEDFVKVHIATEKEVLFDLAITPVQSTQNVHVLNHWRHKLGDELGFDSSFITNIGTMGQDPFRNSDGNALDAFFSVFTPEYVIKTLTVAINARKTVLCELAKKIFEDNNLTADQKVEMFTFEESIQNGDKCAKIESMMYGYFKGLTKKAVEYYLIKESIVISKTQDNEPFESSNTAKSKRNDERDRLSSDRKYSESGSNPHTGSSINPPILDG